MLFGRRLTFGIVILAAQVLLLAMSVAWVVQLALIAVNGHICFEESNSAILYVEIAAVTLIGIFALVVFAIQYRRLGEKRAGEDRRRRNGDGG
jgi:membrane protein implicated in regulation of membrane protease activity